MLSTKLQNNLLFYLFIHLSEQLVFMLIFYNRQTPDKVKPYVKVQQNFGMYDFFCAYKVPVLKSIYV